MALRQTTGSVESLLRRIGLDWQPPDFSTHSRRPKTLAVNNPDPASKGPLHHMTTTSDMGDVEPVNASGSSEPARHAARTIGPDPGRSGDRQCHRRWGLRHPKAPRHKRRTGAERALYGRCTGCRRRHSAPQDCEAWEVRDGRGHSAQRGAAGVEIPRPRALATMDRLSPPKPRRGQNVTSVKLLGQLPVARDFDRQVAEFLLHVAVPNSFTALGIRVTKVAGQVRPRTGAVCPSADLCNKARSPPNLFKLPPLSLAHP